MNCFINNMPHTNIYLSFYTSTMRRFLFIMINNQQLVVHKMDPLSQPKPYLFLFCFLKHENPVKMSGLCL